MYRWTKHAIHSWEILECISIIWKSRKYLLRKIVSSAMPIEHFESRQQESRVTTKQSFRTSWGYNVMQLVVDMHKREKEVVAMSKIET